MEIEDAILSECSAIEAVKSLHEQINMRDTNIMLLKKKILDSMPVVQLYHKIKLERDKLLKEMSILEEENSINQKNLQKALIENLALNKDYDVVSKKHEVMQHEYDEILLKDKGQVFLIKQLKNLTASLETKIEAGAVDAQLTSANHKEVLAEAKAKFITLEKEVRRLNSTNDKKILHLYDFIAFLGDSVASGTLSKLQKQKLNRCKIHAKLLRSKSHAGGEESILEDVDESNFLDVYETQGPFSCASSVDNGLGSSVCTSDDEKYPSTATTPTRDSYVCPTPPSFAFTLPTSPKLTHLPKQHADASTSPLKIKMSTVGCDPICLERNIMKVNIATSPIKEFPADNLKPAQPKDDIEDSTVRDILSKTSQPFKIISPIPFNEAMDSIPVRSLPVTEVVVEPAMKTKGKHPGDIFKPKKKKKFKSLISYLSVMTRTMIKEELKKMNPIRSTPAEKGDSEKSNPVKETKNNEKQVIVLNNSNSTDSNQLTLPNQSGYIIVNTAPGTVFHMSSPAATPAPPSKHEESNPTPGSSEHHLKHSANREFSDICTDNEKCHDKLHNSPLHNRGFRKGKKSSFYQSANSQDVQKTKYIPKHSPSGLHKFKEKRKSSNKFIFKDLFESDNDVTDDQQTCELRRPRTSLSDDEDCCSSVTSVELDNHSDYRRAGKYNLKSDKQSSRSRNPRMSFSDNKNVKLSDLEREHNYFKSETPKCEKNNLNNDQRSRIPHDEVNKEVEVERVSKYIDLKTHQSENNKNDAKNDRSRRSPRTSFSDKKDYRNEEIKKTLLAATGRSDKNKLNIDQQTCTSRRKRDIVLSDKRDHHICKDNIAVTVKRVDKYSDLQKSISNKEHKSSRTEPGPKTNFADKNDYDNNELQNTEKCFDSKFSRKIKHSQASDKQSCDLRTFSDIEDHHIFENDDPVEVEKNIHNLEKNKRKRKFSESLEPLSEIRLQKEKSCESNIKSGQLSSSFDNQNNSCAEFAQTNADVIDAPRKKSLSFSESSVNTNNYSHDHLRSKKRISLCTIKKDHVKTAKLIHEEKETHQRVTRQTKTFDSPAELLSSPRQRLASVSESTSNCNITDTGSPEPKRLKINTRSIPEIANSPMEKSYVNIVNNIVLENIKNMENAKIVLSRLQFSKPTQERAFIRKKVPIITKTAQEPELLVIPVTVQEPTSKDNYNTSDVREAIQTVAETQLNVINVPNPQVKTNNLQRINNSWNMGQTERISDENNKDVGNPIFKTMLVNYIQDKKSLTRIPITYCKPVNLCDKLEKYLASQYSEENLDEFVESIYGEPVEDIGCAMVEFLSNHDRHKDIPIKMNIWSPAPSPVYQTRLLNLLNRLHASPPPHYETSLMELVMKGIEYQAFRLNETPSVVSLKSLTCFYALLCKLTGQKDKLKIFCMDALYCLSFSAAPVVFCALLSWPNLFPHSTSLAAKDPLMIVLVHFLLSHFSTKFLYCAEPLKTLLFNKYGYATGSITDDELLKMLLERVKNNATSPYNESISMAFMLLGKRLGVDWCHKHIIQNGLLPGLLDESRSPRSRAMAAHLIGLLVRPFSNTMHLSLEVITKIYENRIQHGDDPLVEDALISSMTYFAKTNLPSMIGSIIKWTPKQPVSEHTKSLLNELLFLKTHGQWNRLIKAYSKKWGIYMSYSKKKPNLGKNKSLKIKDNVMVVNS